MENTIYDKEYFIKKFEAIPENKMCQGTMECEGAKCALGHCGVTGDYVHTDESMALTNLFDENYTELSNIISSCNPVMRFNDSCDYDNVRAELLKKLKSL